MTPRTALRRMTAGALQLAFCMGAVTSALAQSFPTKPIRIICPYPVGGGIDVLGRLLADRLASQWGQPIVVENQPGASTIPATERAIRAGGDGHTLLLTTDSTISINPHLFPKLPYEPTRDLMPITQLVFLQQLLVAQPGFAPNTVAEVVALARAKPGTLNYGSYGNGSQPHLAGEMLKSKAGVDIAHIPYKGLPLAVAAVLGGEIQMTFAGIASSRPQINAGKLKALAIGGARRSPLLPTVPTFAEQGYPEVETHAWFGLFAPAGTPRATVDRIARDVAIVFKDDGLREREIVQKGYELVLSSPDEFTTFIRGDTTNRARAVRISGARGE
jgi:tripartite-type tricarboxylate transporter receptor subunit TctC